MTVLSIIVPHLPYDLVFTEIFILLPVKTLARFKLVCKKWHSFISSPKFIQMHNNRWMSDPSVQAKCALIISSETIFMFDYDTFDTSIGIDSNSLVQICRSNTFGLGAFLIGSCNGLICLDRDRNSEKCDIHIYNPCTGQTHRVPDPYPVLNYGGCNLIFGFGYVSSLDDYKLVIVGLRGDRSLVMVYSLYSKKWRVACQFSEHDFLKYSGISAVLVSETLHWEIESKSDIDSISGFDLVEEVFKEVKLPFNVPQHDFRHSFKMCVMDDCLCMWEETSFGMTTLWMLKEYGDWESWSMVFNMHWEPLGFTCFDKFFGFTKHGKFLAERDDGKIMLVDPGQDPPTFVLLLESFIVLDVVGCGQTLVLQQLSPCNNDV